MNVLILGSGAKDHALLWWFSKSRLISSLFIAPGNIATSLIATNLSDIDPASAKDVYKACIDNHIEYVFTGTEAPIFNGVVKYLAAKGIPVLGATEEASKLEGDRSFSRSFFQKYNIPSPEATFFTSERKLKSFLKENKGKRFVIKSNNVAPSRVMLTSDKASDLLSFASPLFSKNSAVLVEEEIKGKAASCTLLLDGEHFLPLPLTGDYTSKSLEEDIPTGGMGSICPIAITESLREKLRNKIINPILKGMKDENLMYKGVMTLSIIIRDDEPYLVDFHVRFNDPAAQAIIPLLQNDAADITLKMLQGKLDEVILELKPDFTVAVVLASEGYPVKPKIGLSVKNITPQFLLPLNGFPYVFCGALKKDKKGNIVTSGGRNITVVGRGETINEANADAYNLIRSKNIAPLWYRNDIGKAYISE